MIAKSWRGILAGALIGSLVLLTIHDVARAKEQSQAPCQVCALVARTACHAPKAAPAIVSRAARIGEAPLPAVKIVCRALPRATSRDPPAA